MDQGSEKRHNGCNRHTARWPWALVAALCLVSLPLACALGSLSLEFSDVFAALRSLMTGSQPPSEALALTPEGTRQLLDGRSLMLIVGDLRLPRVLLGFLSGAGLAVAGCVFQGILRNPLADPFTLGISGGAAFGAALAISLGLTGALMGYSLPLAAFLGAGAALAAVLALGRIGGGLRHETLVLAGVVVSAFLAALIALVKALDEASVTGIVFWIMGSFQGRGWRDLSLLLPGLTIGCALAFALARELDILSLGDGVARRLGLGAGRIRLVLLLAAGALTASCVAVSGIIGFVGLIIPHLCRLALGAGHRLLLPASALSGGLLLMWSDVAARTLLPRGIELPVGVVTAILGGPFFCWILGRGKGKTARFGSQDASGHDASAFETPVADCCPSTTSADTTIAAIDCQDVATGYSVGLARNNAQAKRIVDAVTFRQKRGEIVGLLGPNGSGKSTLLRCVAGLLPVWQGQILVCGQDIGALREKKRALLLASLPQRPEVIPALPVFDLALMGRYAHTPFLGGYDQHDREVTGNCLARTRVAHLASRSADTLSGGELQRVLLARALAQEAPVLLLDEPASGLDPACQGQIMAVLQREAKERGVSVLAAMHELNLAALYCDRLVFIRQGRIIADGPTAEVFTQEILREVYGAELTVMPHPVSGRPQALANS